MIQFEKNVVEYLGLPSIPKKQWQEGDGAFDKGVAIVALSDDRQAYAACEFNSDKGQTKPSITKVFGIEPFTKILAVFVVPDYMSTLDDVVDMDLDDDSKKKAKQLLNEAAELENDGVVEENPMDKLPEWIFPEIEGREQAVAWLKNYQSRNRRKGRIPTTEENIKLRLYSIYTELQKKTK